MNQQTIYPEPGEQAVGRRERKKQETWRGLHRAALALCTEKGFEHVTVEEICERADVSTRTFFNYFPCKEDAVLGGTAGFDDVVERLLARPADEAPFAAFANTYIEKSRTLGEHAESIRMRYRLIEANQQLKARELARVATFEAVLAGAIAERMGVDVETDPYPALVAAVGMAVLRSSFKRWQAGDGGESLPDLVETGFAAVLAGLPAR